MNALDKETESFIDIDVVPPQNEVMEIIEVSSLRVVLLTLTDVFLGADSSRPRCRSVD